MPGCWEIAQRGSVYAYTIHTDITTIEWACRFKELIIPGVFRPISGMPFDHARNSAAKEMLDGGFDWLFSLDSDVAPPPDAILRLMAHNKPFISGLYCRRSPPWSVPVMMIDGKWVTNYKRGSTIEVHLVGAGCLLIHRSVVEDFFRNPQRPGKPMFDWRVDMQGVYPPHKCLSEDFTLCQEVRSRGGKVLVDTSVQCRHLGFAESTDGHFAPMVNYPVGMR